MKDKWIQLALRLAEAAAPTSADRYHKVGCAILRQEGSVCGIGFNGQPPGVDLTEEEAMHRDFRRRLTTHAESNALAFCQPGDPYLLAVTLPPCDRCLVDAVRYGVKLIVCYPSPEPDTHPVPFELAQRLKVELRVVERDSGIKGFRG
jgi:deoxycytidylate deaminase